jgi:hypothetical protein
VVCQQWSDPIDPGQDVFDYASQALAASSGQPVTERLSDGYVYLFTAEHGTGSVVRGTGTPWPTIRRCWLDQGGAIGSCPPEPPTPPPPPRGTIGDVTSAPLQDATSPPVPPQGAPAAAPGAAPQVPVVTRPHPKGMKGVRKGAKEIAERMVASMRSRLVIEWARNVVKAAGSSLGPRGYADPDKVVAALFEAWKKEVAFIADPVNTELMIGAVQLLCLDPHGSCIPAGDCDDQLIGLGGAIMTCGIPVWIRLRWYQGQPQAHVTLLYDAGPRGGGPVHCIDPSIDSGQCSGAQPTTEIVLEPNSGEDEAEGVFIGIGAPAAIGAPPVPHQELRALEREAFALEQAAERVRASSAAYAAARAGKGLPAVDMTPVGPGSPLGWYLSVGSDVAGSWSAPAAEAESKLLQTASFLGGVVADALAGARSVTVTQGDVLVSARSGDVFGVLATPDASGQLRAWYVDVATGAPAGFIGAAPMQSARAATSLQALRVVRSLLEALARAHAADARALQPDGTIGALRFVTPSDVLAYRAMWNPYVQAIAKAAQSCADAWAAVAAGGQSPLVNLGQFAIPPDQTTLQEWADIWTLHVTDIYNQWNQFTGETDAQIVEGAAAMLEAFQAAVLKCGQYWVPQLQRDCPGVPLPTPPTVVDQVQVIAHLEGLGVLASGVLQILGVGADGALEGLGKAADWTEKKVSQIVDTVTSPWLWLTLALVALAVVFIYAPRAGAAVIRTHRQLRPRAEPAPKPTPAPASERSRRRRRAPRRARAALEDWPDDHAGHSKAAYRGWSRRRQESERAAANIPTDYLPLWDRVQGMFRGTSHERYEAFMQYAEEHPDEVIEAIAIDAEKSFEQQRQAAGF